MKAKEIEYMFDFNKEITDKSKIKCPACHEISPLSDWFEIETGCEDCGTHGGTRCPKCEEDFDCVHEKRIFEVIE